MIDNLSILLSHGLIALAFWRLLSRDDLDKESPAPKDQSPAGFAHKNTQKNLKNTEKTEG